MLIIWTYRIFSKENGALCVTIMSPQIAYKSFLANLSCNTVHDCMESADVAFQLTFIIIIEITECFHMLSVLRHWPFNNIRLNVQKCNRL